MRPSRLLVVRLLGVCLGLGLVAASSCGRVDGTPTDLGAASGLACVQDLTCGPGRHCASGHCAIDCVTSSDCGYEIDDPTAPNDLVCTPCGRCLSPGALDVGCLSATDRPCVSTADCTSSLDDRYVCGDHDLCERTCTENAECADIGSGWACNDHRCVRACSRDDDCLSFGWKYACSLPKGVDPVVNAEALDPVLGECLAKPSGVGFPTPSLDDPPTAKYQGVWGWMHASSVAQENVPLVGELFTTSIQYLLVKVNFDGADVVFHTKWCHIDLKNFAPDGGDPVSLFDIVIPDKNADSIKVYEVRAHDVPALATGATFDLDPLVDVRGARLDNPATDPLPTNKDLTHQWDQDRDGKPGMTAAIVGSLAGEIYQAQRSIFEFHARVYDEDHLGGLLHDTPSANVIGASSQLLINKSYSVAYGDPVWSYFRAQRMSDDASCDDVLALSTQDGGWLHYVEKFDESKQP